jgi:RNA polymerase sigma factor (sigma-70 family)
MEKQDDKSNLRLTYEQQELVSSNHNLIYSYAHNRNISLDDYYDLLAIGLCKAAKSFDETKGAFSTYAYRCMQNELNMYWRSINSKSSIPQDYILYYHAQQNTQNTDNKDFLELFYDYDSYESIDYAIMLSEFTNSLEDKEREIVDMLISGMTHNEIAKGLSCSRQNIDYYAKIIRNKLLSYINK